MRAFLCLYAAIAVLVFVPYFNYRAIHDKGFAPWVRFGEIGPTAQALAWPYYGFKRRANAVTVDRVQVYFQAVGRWWSGPGAMSSMVSDAIEKSRQQAALFGDDAGQRALVGALKHIAEEMNSRVEVADKLFIPAKLLPFHKEMLSDVRWLASVADRMVTAVDSHESEQVEELDATLFSVEQRAQQRLEAEMKAAAYAL